MAHHKTFEGDFKKFFGRGLAILLPSVLTLWILWQAFVFVFQNVAEPINSGTRTVVLWVVPRVVTDESLPEWFVIDRAEINDARVSKQFPPGASDEVIRAGLRRQYLRQYWDQHWYLNLTGLIVAILLIYLAGVLLSNLIGKRIYARLERLISQIPGFKQVYPHVKQVVDLILGEKKMAFRDVVIVEYPSEGIWTIGFLTGSSVRQIDAHAGEAVSTVFIPTSPTPFTGFTINVPRSKIHRLDMTVEEALRFVLTAGVLTPEDPTGEKLSMAKEGGARTARGVEATRARRIAETSPAEGGDDAA
ncbi:MAG: DUF502 domain-containing protein [Phycisphaerales bacterium]